MSTIQYNSASSFQKATSLISRQHKHKLDSSDKIILKLLDKKSFLSLSSTCRNNIQILIKLKNPVVEKFIDLRAINILKRSIAPNFKHSRCLMQASELVKKMYETDAQRVSEPKWGYISQTNPELMHYAMFLAENEVVLELAGATGKNAALLGFSGAKRVYMNDLLSQEVPLFKALCQDLPPEVQEKLEAILGSCFDILKLKPELKGKVGLLICNNFIHFLTDEKLNIFLTLVKALLKPGGKAIFTANAYSGATVMRQEIMDANPNHTAWTASTIYLHNHEKSTLPVACLVRYMFPAHPSQVSPGGESLQILTKSPSASQWIETPGSKYLLPPETVKKIKSIAEEQFKDIRIGEVALLINTQRLFRQENLASLFQRAGFAVEQTFLLGRRGHLYLGSTPYEDLIDQVGIIIQKPVAV